MEKFDDYTADTDLLKNPERGMYYEEPLEPGDDDYDTSWIVAEWLWLAPACHDNLVWDPTNPDPQATSPVLKKYAEEKLDKARSEGYKILFRPRYDDENDQGEVSDGCKYLINDVPVFHADSKDRQFNHIDAVAAMLGDYKDVIAFIQAGYLGAWGEWNDGDFAKVNVPLLYTRPDRNDILDHVLSEYDAKGIAQDVELRRPVFAKEVFVRNDSANVGLHNDCFMSSDNDDPSKNSDSGTYSHFKDFLKFSDFSDDNLLQNLSEDLCLKTEDDARKWAKDWTEHSSFGGETCPSNGNERWRFCNNMTGDPGEPAKLHLCYLNAERSNTVSEWTAQGCYNDIRRNLGYRFEVTCVEYTETVTTGDTFSVAVDVKNTGWARLHKPRDAYLVLRNGATTHEYKFSGGPVSNWAPRTPGTPPPTTTISVSDSAPPPGTYSVRLWIPDPDLLEFLSTAPNPEDYKNAKTNYAVKLATKLNGANVFDQTTGENDLGVEIKVQ